MGGGDKGVPFPAAIAVVAGRDGERLLVADNLSDDVLLMDAATGTVLTRFDLRRAMRCRGLIRLRWRAKDGTRAFVALWNASEVVELDLEKGMVGRKLALLKPANPVRGPILVRWSCRRMGRRCMWRWRIGMRWRRWMWRERSLR